MILFAALPPPPLLLATKAEQGSERKTILKAVERFVVWIRRSLGKPDCFQSYAKLWSDLTSYGVKTRSEVDRVWCWLISYHTHLREGVRVLVSCTTPSIRYAFVAPLFESKISQSRQSVAGLANMGNAPVDLHLPAPSPGFLCNALGLLLQ